MPTGTVTREQLIECMGMPINEIYRSLVGDPSGADRFLKRLAENEDRLMISLGGTLYPGVKEQIPRLASRYRLFMLSNCSALGLPNFLAYTGLGEHFTDTISYGVNLQQKDHNIRLLMQRHNLTSAHSAGIPMLLARYGFGDAPDAEYSADSFGQLAQMLLE